MTLGEKIYTLRQNDKKTLNDLANYLDVSMNTVYRWEHDLSTPRKMFLSNIAKYYKVSMEYLLSSDTSLLLIDRYEQHLIKAIRKISDDSKYRILGYVERVCVEDSGYLPAEAVGEYTFKY